MLVNLEIKNESLILVSRHSLHLNSSEDTASQSEWQFSLERKTTNKANGFMSNDVNKSARFRNESL